MNDAIGSLKDHQPVGVRVRSDYANEASFLLKCSIGAAVTEALEVTAKAVGLRVCV